MAPKAGPVALCPQGREGPGPGTHGRRPADPGATPALPLGRLLLPLLLLLRDTAAMGDMDPSGWILGPLG